MYLRQNPAGVVLLPARFSDLVEPRRRSLVWPHLPIEPPEPRQLIEFFAYETVGMAITNGPLPTADFS